MLPWKTVFLTILAAIHLNSMDHEILTWLSAIAAIGCLFSWGLMHAYAARSAKQRENSTGLDYRLTEADALSVPDWITYINMAFTILAFLMMAMAINIEFEIV